MAPYCLWHTRDGQGNKWRPFYLGQVLLIQINVVFGRRSFLTGKESGSGRLFFCSRVPTTRLRSCETSLEWLAAVDRRSRWCFGVTSSVIGWWLTWEISFSLSLSLSSFSGRTNRVRSFPVQIESTNSRGIKVEKKTGTFLLDRILNLNWHFLPSFLLPFVEWIVDSQSHQREASAVQPNLFIELKRITSFSLFFFFCSLWFFLFPVPWMNKVSLISTTPRGKNLRTFSPSGVLYLP